MEIVELVAASMLKFSKCCGFLENIIQLCNKWLAGTPEDQGKLAGFQFFHNICWSLLRKVDEQEEKKNKKQNCCEKAFMYI